jgi:hypothetical protein
VISTEQCLRSVRPIFSVELGRAHAVTTTVTQTPMEGIITGCRKLTFMVIGGNIGGGRWFTINTALREMQA